MSIDIARETASQIKVKRRIVPTLVKAFSPEEMVQHQQAAVARIAPNGQRTRNAETRRQLALLGPALILKIQTGKATAVVLEEHLRGLQQREPDEHWTMDRLRQLTGLQEQVEHFSERDRKAIHRLQEFAERVEQGERKARRAHELRKTAGLIGRRSTSSKKKPKMKKEQRPSITISHSDNSSNMGVDNSDVDTQPLFEEQQLFVEQQQLPEEFWVDPAKLLRAHRNSVLASLPIRTPSQRLHEQAANERDQRSKERRAVFRAAVIGSSSSSSKKKKKTSKKKDQAKQWEQATHPSSSRSPTVSKHKLTRRHTSHSSGDNRDWTGDALPIFKTIVDAREQIAQHKQQLLASLQYANITNSTVDTMSAHSQSGLRRKWNLEYDDLITKRYELMVMMNHLERGHDFFSHITHSDHIDKSPSSSSSSNHNSGNRDSVYVRNKSTDNTSTTFDHSDNGAFGAFAQLLESIRIEDALATDAESSKKKRRRNMQRQDITDTDESDVAVVRRTIARISARLEQLEDHFSGL